MKTTKQWLEEYKVPGDSLNAMGYVLNVRELIDAIKAEYKPLHDANHRLFEYLKSCGIESMIENSCADTATVYIQQLQADILKIRSTITAQERVIAELKADKERLDWLDKNMIGSQGPVRESDDHHPIHYWSFEAPVYDEAEGGLRKAIDIAIAQTKAKEGGK